MTKSETTIDKAPDVKEPSIWIYIISVSLSIVLIITISRSVFNLVPERSDFVETETVANEAYKKYSHQLDALSEKSAKEIVATTKGS